MYFILENFWVAWWQVFLELGIVVDEVNVDVQRSTVHIVLPVDLGASILVLLFLTSVDNLEFVLVDEVFSDLSFAVFLNKHFNLLLFRLLLLLQAFFFSGRNTGFIVWWDDFDARTVLDEFVEGHWLVRVLCSFDVFVRIHLSLTYLEFPNVLYQNAVVSLGLFSCRWSLSFDHICQVLSETFSHVNGFYVFLCYSRWIKPEFAHLLFNDLRLFDFLSKKFVFWV